VVFPAPFFPIRAILSFVFILRFEFTNRGSATILFERFIIFMRLDAILLFPSKRYFGIVSREYSFKYLSQFSPSLRRDEASSSISNSHFMYFATRLSLVSCFIFAGIVS